MNRNRLRVRWQSPPAPPIEPRKAGNPQWLRRPDAMVDLAPQLAARSIRLGGDIGPPRTAHRQCPTGHDPFGPHRGIQDGQVVGRAGHPEIVRTTQRGRPALHVALVRSWQQVSDFRVRPVSTAKPTDYFHPDKSAWSEFGYACRSGHTIIHDQDPVRPLVRNERWHACRRCSEPGDLPLELERVGAAASGIWDA